jgi:hypothetical protein
MLAEFMEAGDLDRLAGIRHLRAAGTDQQQHLATLVADQMEDAAAVRLSGCGADACALDLRARQSRAGACQLPAAGGLEAWRIWKTLSGRGAQTAAA